MRSDENFIKRNNKDSFFRYLFSESKNFVDLYRACSGRRLNENEINPFDLSSGTVRRPITNDVSFLTNDNQLLILAEHQSTPNPNMALRELIYYAELVRQWLTTNGLDLAARSKVEVPMPEFYVIYNGKLAYNEERLAFGNDFIEVKAKLLDIDFEKLEEKQPANMLAGYSYFYNQYDMKRAEGASSEVAFDYAVEQCKRAGYLHGVVEKEDFVLTYRELFSREDDLRYEGETIGFAKGETLGFARGETQGREEAEVRMLRAAVKSGVHADVLKIMVRESGISAVQADEILREAGRNILVNTSGEKPSTLEQRKAQAEKRESPPDKTTKKPKRDTHER